MTVRIEMPLWRADAKDLQQWMWDKQIYHWVQLDVYSHTQCKYITIIHFNNEEDATLFKLTWLG